MEWEWNVSRVVVLASGQALFIRRVARSAGFERGHPSKQPVDKTFSPLRAVVVRFTFCFYRAGREQSTTGAARRRGGSWKQRKEKGGTAVQGAQAPDGRTDGRACRRRHQSCTAAHSLHLPCHARCSAAVAVGSAGARPRRDVDLCCWADRRRRQRAGEETGRGWGDPAWMGIRGVALPVLPTFPRALRSAGSVWPAVPTSASLPRHHHAYCFVLVCSEVFCMCSSAGRGTRLAGVFVRSSSTGWAGTACSFLFRSCESLNDGMGWQLAGRVVPVIKRNPNAPCATGPSLQQFSHGPPRRCSPRL